MHLNKLYSMLISGIDFRRCSVDVSYIFTNCLTRLYHVLNRFLIEKLTGRYLNSIIVNLMIRNLDNMLIEIKNRLVKLPDSDEPHRQLNNIDFETWLID